MRPALTIFLVLALLAPTHAAEPARTYTSIASFAVTVSPQFTLEKLGSAGEPAATFASVLPQDARGLSVVGLRSSEGFYFRLAAAATEGQSVQRPYVAAQFGTGRPQLAPLDSATATAPLASIAVWSPGTPSTDGAVILLAFASPEQDRPLLGYHLDCEGAWHRIDLGGAKSLGGAYEIRDLDGDGSYELLTVRSLDGWNGGITYTAGRAYDAQARAYRPDPDRFRDYFRSELAFYDWVLATRDKIVANPEAYMSREPRGWYFAADYNGRTIGFDSLIPLGDFEFAAGNVAHWNQRVENATRRVTEYRDQLKAWLDSAGPYPTAWQIRK